MNIEEFTNEILKEVLDMVKGSFELKITENRKNNGVIRPALSALSPKHHSGPSIYLDSYFERYKAGDIKTGDAAADVYRQIMEYRNHFRDISLSDLQKWENAKTHIYAKLVNREMNKRSLADMPHRDFLDLAVVYYVEVDGATNEDVTGSFMVKNSHMQAWEQEEENLYCTACGNMRACKPPLFKNIKEVMREIMQEEIPFAEWEDLPSPGMYVLTNQKKLFGSAELLDKSILREIGDKFGSDYIVFPSSIHECVIMPADDKFSYRELADTVCEINRTQVFMEERLSDHVYLYEREEGELRIAA